MIRSQDGTFKSITGFGISSFSTPEAAQADEANFRKWAEARAGRPITDREALNGIHFDQRPLRDQMMAKERRQSLFNPPGPADTRLPEEVVADDAERRAEQERRETLPLHQKQAIEAREAADAARKAADLQAERDRIRQTTDFANAREALVNLKVEVAFDPNASFELLEEIELQIDLLDNKQDILAARESSKVLKRSAREKTENFLSSQRHVDIAKERLDRAYKDLPYDVQFWVSQGNELVRLSDPQTGKVVNLSIADYEKRTPETVHRFINDNGRTREEMAARSENQ